MQILKPRPVQDKTPDLSPREDLTRVAHTLHGPLPFRHHAEKGPDNHTPPSSSPSIPRFRPRPARIPMHAISFDHEAASNEEKFSPKGEKAPDDSTPRMEITASLTPPPQRHPSRGREDARMKISPRGPSTSSRDNSLSRSRSNTPREGPQKTVRVDIPALSLTQSSKDDEGSRSPSEVTRNFYRKRSVGSDHSVSPRVMRHVRTFSVCNDSTDLSPRSPTPSPSQKIRMAASADSPLVGVHKAASEDQFPVLPLPLTQSTEATPPPVDRTTERKQSEKDLKVLDETDTFVNNDISPGRSK